MVPDVFTVKDEAWSKFKDSLTDYAESCNDGLKLQLDWTLKQKEEITQSVLKNNPLGSTDREWVLRLEIYKLLKLKTDVNSEARKIVECIGDGNGYEVWRLLGLRYEASFGTKRFSLAWHDTTVRKGLYSTSAEELLTKTCARTSCGWPWIQSLGPTSLEKWTWAG